MTKFSLFLLFYGDNVIAYIPVAKSGILIYIFLFLISPPKIHDLVVIRSESLLMSIHNTCFVEKKGKQNQCD